MSGLLMNAKRFWFSADNFKRAVFSEYILLIQLYSKNGFMLQAWVKGSTWIPVFDVDTSADLGGLSKKFSNFVMGM